MVKVLISEVFNPCLASNVVLAINLYKVLSLPSEEFELTASSHETSRLAHFEAAQLANNALMR